VARSQSCTWCDRLSWWVMVAARSKSHERGLHAPEPVCEVQDEVCHTPCCMVVGAMADQEMLNGQAVGIVSRHGGLDSHDQWMTNNTRRTRSVASDIASGCIMSNSVMARVAPLTILASHHRGRCWLGPWR
jgi:hypothetical protein